ncbi:MAG: pro-sigmaK processing inhibitor BofA family protein [Oscillospiraceae bacterium]
MKALAEAVPLLVIFLLVVALLAVFRRPLRWAGRLAARTGLGLAVLAVFGQISSFLGVALGVNLVNALVLGVLGVPGFGLLLMLNWMFAAC